MYTFLSNVVLGVLSGAQPLNVLPQPTLEERRFKITFYCSDKRCCGRHSPQRGGNGNTATGHAPVPFRTAASGDPELVGKWVLLPDLHGEVFVSDTGVRCQPGRKSKPTIRKRAKSGSVAVKGCVAPNQLDIFIGGAEWHTAALRMGVQEWTGRVMR